MAVSSVTGRRHFATSELDEHEESRNGRASSIAHQSDRHRSDLGDLPAQTQMSSATQSIAPRATQPQASRQVRPFRLNLKRLGEKHREHRLRLRERGAKVNLLSPSRQGIGIHARVLRDRQCPSS